MGDGMEERVAISSILFSSCFFFFQAEDGIRDISVWLEFRRVLFRSIDLDPVIESVNFLDLLNNYKELNNEIIELEERSKKLLSVEKLEEEFKLLLLSVEKVANLKEKLEVWKELTIKAEEEEQQLKSKDKEHKELDRKSVV